MDQMPEIEANRRAAAMWEVLIGMHQDGVYAVAEGPEERGIIDQRTAAEAVLAAARRIGDLMIDGTIDRPNGGFLLLMLMGARDYILPLPDAEFDEETLREDLEAVVEIVRLIRRPT